MKDYYKNKNDIDEFWNDCIKNENSFFIYRKDSSSVEKYIKKLNEYNILSKNLPHKKIKINLKKSSGRKEDFLKRELYIDESDCTNFKSKIISTAHSSPFNKDILNDIFYKEELIPIKKKEKENSFENNTFIQYKNKVNKLLTQKTNCCERVKYLKSQLECTFKPEKSKNKKLEKKIIKLYKNTDIYGRNIKIQQKKKEKIAFMFAQNNKKYKNKMSLKCIFHPIIKTVDLKKSLYNENKWKISADNDSNKLFLLRYMKAREEEIDKKKKLNSHIYQKLRKTFSYRGNLIRNLSRKDSLILQNNLHKSLNSFQNLFKNEEDNDEEDTGLEVEEEKKEPINLRYMDWKLTKIN